MRAYATALQPPAGPVFLSLPIDDGEKPALEPAEDRTVATRVAPDPAPGSAVVADVAYHPDHTGR
jgi:benzoylformate decarboxylase